MKQDPNMKDIPYSLTEEEFIKIVNTSDFVSVIGHHQLSDFLTELTGKEIEYNRKGVTLRYNDEVLVFYLTGRLPEHPTFVEYKSRANFSYIRFEKQTQSDILKSVSRIEEMTKMEEI